jgi:hypothetical protein
MTQSTNHNLNIQSVTNGQGAYDLFVTNDNRYSIKFSEIEEYGMLKFISSVQIRNDKQNQQLLFQSRKIKFEYQNGESCYYLDKSDIVILLTPCTCQKYFDLLYVLFDFNKNVFTTINVPNFRLTEIDKNLVKLEINFRYSYDENVKDQILQDDGKLIDLTKLTWYNIDEIDKACFLTTKNNR